MPANFRGGRKSLCHRATFNIPPVQTSLAVDGSPVESRPCGFANDVPTPIPTGYCHPLDLANSGLALGYSQSSPLDYLFALTGFAACGVSLVGLSALDP